MFVVICRLFAGYLPVICRLFAGYLPVILPVGLMVIWGI
jgi:hypothetical protein